MSASAPRPPPPRWGSAAGQPLYFDHNASTPVPHRVVEAMQRALAEGFGNPSSDHAYGRRAKQIVETSRAQVAALLGCDTDEIVFTSGATESTNLALRGYAATSRHPITLVTSSVEHPATNEPADWLGRVGATITRLPVTGDGVIEPAIVQEALRLAAADRPVLATFILAQNETGVIQPIEQIAPRVIARGGVLHVDGAQAVGKIPVNVRELGVDLMSVAGHKLYAPKGVGALYVRRGVELAPLLVGAGHERGLRPGTENVAGIAALGEACTMAREDVEQEAERQRALVRRLVLGLAHGGFVEHGDGAPRLPNTVNGRFPGVRGSALAEHAKGVAFSTGSACHAGQETPSPVLSAMGIPPSRALGAIRLSIGRWTTEAEIDRAVELLLAAARAALP